MIVPTPNPRRFPAPWSLDETDACFVVQTVSSAKALGEKTIVGYLVDARKQWWTAAPA